MRGVGLRISDETDIIIQHLRIRYGHESAGNPNFNESSIRLDVDGSKLNQDIIIDHNSLSWATDGNIDIFTKGPNANNDRITVSNNIMSEPLDLDNRESKNLSLSAYHGGTTTDGVTNFLALNNIMAHGEYRSPQLQGTSAVFVNNLSYNIKEQVFNIVGNKMNKFMRITSVANDIVGGPNSEYKYGEDYILSFGAAAAADCEGAWKQPLSGHQLYFFGNRSEAGAQSNSSDWAMVDYKRGNNCDTSMKVTGENPLRHAPDWPTGLTFIAASAVEAALKPTVGARPADRDIVDDCIIANVTNRTGRTIEDNPSEGCGPWPTLAKNTTTLVIPSNPFADDDSDGYTNIEEWLHLQAAIVEGKSGPRLSPPDGFNLF